MQPWTRREEEWLIANRQLSHAEAARHLGRTLGSVLGKVEKLQKAGRLPHGRKDGFLGRLTAEGRALLLDMLAAGYDNRAIARAVGLTVHSVKNYRSRTAAQWASRRAR